jgi:hypothetical protein
MLHVGGIYRFSYLWAWQHEAGEESGRKVRPVCLMLKMAKPSGRLYLFPITTVLPDPDRISVEIPFFERRRAGLDQICWLLLDEYNLTSEAAAYDFESLNSMGQISAAFLREVAAIIKRVLSDNKMKAVPRL